MLINKHRFISLGMLVSLAGLTYTPTITAASAIQVYLDGTRLTSNAVPIVDHGMTLVEFQSIFENLGLEVSFDSQTQTVSGKKDGLDIRLRIGSHFAIVNGEIKSLPSPPQMINGRTFIPLRFVGEASGKNVSWDSVNNTVSIYSGESHR